MIMTSFLYHAFGIVGYYYLRTLYEEGKVFFGIGQEKHRLRCSACSSRNVKLRGKTKRRFQSLPIGGKQTFIDFEIPRVECRDCGLVRQVKVRFADPRRTYTRPFERYVLDLSRHMTISDVADHLGISWDIVKDIQKRHLTKRYKRPRLKHLRRIAIDEICIGKGHKYLTVVLNLSSGAVVYVGDGKGGDALQVFWKRLKRSRARVEAVAVDMSPAFTAAIIENLPSAAIVYDRFHIMKMYNEKIDDLRRGLQREAEDNLQKSVLKGTRWLLLKNPENLDPDPKKREKERLEDALKLNEPLATAYYLREELREFWNQSSRAEAEEVLDNWIQSAASTGIKVLIDMARSLQAHRFGLLNWYDFPISTGPLEGTNNKIKTLQRAAYGFRDKEFFKLKIMALHETKYALVG